MLDQFLHPDVLLKAFNIGIFLTFALCYSYQLYYVVVVLARKPPRHVAQKNHRYAVMIAARNESAVIADLLRSIRAQDYPADLIDVFVIADNCTDETARIAREQGAMVFERFNTKQVGKGYALDFGYQEIQKRPGAEGYEAYFVFDADNVLDPRFFTEMNATFDSGAQASTSYRNSKNFSSNWISAGYALWFLRESRFLNQARLTLGTSCAISGTGFYLSADILRRAGGWKWHLLTEDIEFSAANVIEGVRVSYCPTAVLYDEQPTTFRDSWDQRFRWAKGFYQVFWHYGVGLVRGLAANRKGYRFACFDMLMTIAPGMLLTFVCIIFNAVAVVLGVLDVMSWGDVVSSSLMSIAFCLLGYLLFMFLFGVLTTCVEWKVIRATRRQKIHAVFTFPFFMATYIPIALAALVRKASWKPIRHSISVDISDFSGAKTGGAAAVPTRES